MRHLQQLDAPFQESIDDLSCDLRALALVGGGDWRLRRYRAARAINVSVLDGRTPTLWRASMRRTRIQTQDARSSR